ncbi:hypothetical protein HPB48_020325 [Haemaphysalis longicornis]|uniref:F-box domain-containing protein n=1 Tax=Haemaphysalis longicornis TaxID=44386 RepID=A0A9J6GRD6_HAELO|nr:hypothetical protein HPB48_020325 [Haemaphysalis longicornis]
MEFDDLPPEVVLKIFSNLSQCFLEVIARVSQRWMKLAFDPSLYTVVCIDSGHNENPQRVQKILERASMLRTLQITADAASFDVVAASSTGLRLLNCLEIPGSSLSHRAMPAILEQCKSLKTIKLRGRHRLTKSDVRMLEMLPSLKTVVTTNFLDITDEILHQLCSSCRRLESLKIRTEHIYREESFGYLKSLHHLRDLSVDVITTTMLVHVSKSCPSLETLEISMVWDDYDISMAEALEGFLHLKSLSVYKDCGREQGWLHRRFRAPPLLERFDVDSLIIREQQWHQLIVSFKETLRHLHITVTMVPDHSLRLLSSCKKIESLSMAGLKGKTTVFSLLSQLPKLHRASLHVVTHSADAVYELMSIVDTKDKSPRGKTRLVFRVWCSHPPTRGQIKLAAYAFKNYLASNTSMTAQHIQEFEHQCSTFSEGSSLPKNLETSLPTMSSTLKYLTLTLNGV